MASTHHWTIDMTPDDKLFYQVLGRRIAKARKDQGLTQTQLAEVLGISQQTMAHYEVGRLRIAVALLMTTAKALEVAVEVLLNEEPKATKGKRGPTSKLQQKIEQIGSLPRTKQKLLMEMIDAVIQQAS